MMDMEMDMNFEKQKQKEKYNSNSSNIIQGSKIKSNIKFMGNSKI